MLVSTRGRYAIRVMIDLAEHMNGNTYLKEIADRPRRVHKYMTKIMRKALTKSGMLDGQHGKGGIQAQ